MIAAFVAEKTKKSEKKSGCRRQPDSEGGIRLFRGLDGSLAELLQVLHEFEGGLTGAGAGGLVSLHDLRFGVLREFGACSIDLFNKLFHDDDRFYYVR